MGKCRHPINRRQIWWQIQRDGGNQFEVNRCYACGAWLPLGPASDTPETAVEVRAARLAIEGDHNSLFLVEALMTDGDTDDHHVIRLAATIAEHPTGADQ